MDDAERRRLEAYGIDPDGEWERVKNEERLGKTTAMERSEWEVYRSGRNEQAGGAVDED